MPVDSDGSVAFEAPANTLLQLQLLDDNGMAVMTMRSSVYLQPGERAACVGCHESRYSTPPTARLMSARVHQIAPPAGPRYEGGFSFARTVQPVLDRYCLNCHGPAKTEGGVDLTGGFPLAGKDESRSERTAGFSNSYGSLIRIGGLVKVAPRNGETYFSRPKDYFAHAGRLAQMLLDGHADKAGKRRVELDRESFQRVVDWLDLNAQCYGDYSFNRIETRMPLAQGERALRAAIEQRFGPELAGQPYPALVNVANPAESRILMGPLSKTAGGWGQITQNAYSSAGDPAYADMRKLVEASIAPLKYQDVAGTCGHENGCRCGDCWVRKDLAARHQPPAVNADKKLAGSR